jgi:hypothetical protein
VTLRRRIEGGTEISVEKAFTLIAEALARARDVAENDLRYKRSYQIQKVIGSRSIAKGRDGRYS